MPLLISRDDPVARVLEWSCNTFVGRRMIGGLNCDWGRPVDREVSSVHAALTWHRRQQSWQLRDLGSVNGTTVDGHLLKQGEARGIGQGSVVGFGGSMWTVSAVGPPPAVATSSRGDRVIALDNVLLLLDEDRVEWVVHRMGDAWWLHRWTGEVPDSEQDGECIGHGHQVRVGRLTWTIGLPIDGPIRTDVGTMRQMPKLACHRLVLDVSPDCETIDARLEGPGEPTVLGHRRYHELWWVLALARKADREAGHPPEETGWVTCRQLGVDLALGSDPMGRLNVWVHRGRQRLKEAGFADYVDLFERRSSGSPMLRLGSPEVVICQR